MWSVGVVLSELLNTMKETEVNYKKRRLIFKSKSCYPMSPSLTMQDDEDGNPILPENDHLKQIFNVTGTPSDLDLSFITNFQAREYIDTVIVNSLKVQRINLSERYPGAKPKLIDLLDRLLEFNPAFRPTVDEALEHPVFKRIRNKEKEPAAKSAIKLSIDLVDSSKRLSKDLLRGFMIETY